jgi:hypothetical protein
MGRIVDLPPGVNLSIRQFCEETSLDRDTTARKIKNAGLKPAGKRGGWPIYRLRDLLSSIYVTDEDGEFDPDKLDPFKRKAHYQAEHEKLSLQVQRSELLPRIAVEQEQARTTKIVARCFDTLPDIIERDCGVSPLIIAKIEQRLGMAREELYKEVIEIDAEEDADSAVL